MEVMHRNCAGMDVHKDSVVVCVRSMKGSKVDREVRTFGTMTSELLKLGDWLEERDCPVAVIEATGVYWKPLQRSPEVGHSCSPEVGHHLIADLFGAWWGAPLEGRRPQAART